jgi:menaquinone-dependent protoporphyrinogen oxidase
MSKVLVAYGSKYGATGEIADAIGRTLRDHGLEVDVSPAHDVRSLDDYDAVVLGSAVYTAHWRGDALRFLKRRKKWLTDHDVWLFSSGPVGEDDEEADQGDAERWTKPGKVRELAAEIGAHDHVVFGGMVDQDRGFVRKKMAAGMPEELRDRRDWDQIAAWATQVSAQISADTQPPPGGSPT